jgi:MFS family permease
MAFAGTIADRYGRRNVMLCADVGRTLVQAATAFTLLFPDPFAHHPPVWLFIAFSALRGVAQAFYSPARSGLTVEIAPRDQLADANALFQIARSAITISGPALGGILVAAFSPGVVVAIDAVTFAISVLTLSLLKFSSVATATEVASDAEAGPLSSVEETSIWLEIAEGWREFRSRAWLWSVTLQFALFNLITWAPWVVLGPVAARQYLGGAAVWGAILTCQGVGAIVAGLYVIGRRPRHLLVVALTGALCFALPDIPMAFHAPAAFVAVAALISGIGDTIFGVFLTTAIQQQVPAEKIARVSAFTDFPALGIGLIGYIVDGPLAASVGISTVFAVGGIYGIFSALVVLVLPATRAVEWRTGASIVP